MRLWHLYFFIIPCFQTVLEVEPYHKFSIPIATENFYDAENDEEGLSCQLVFTYTSKYPDAAPIVEVEETKNFELDQEEKLIEHVTESVSGFFWKFKIKSYFFLIISDKWIFRNGNDFFVSV